MVFNSSDKNPQPIINFDELAYELELQHPEVKEVFTIKLDEYVFIYKPICRKLYKQLVQLDISDLEKEELLCKDCVLWPENFNFDDCDAGIPTQLAEAILKNSYVDSLDLRQKIINLCRQEMYDVDNQVTCLIHEAFSEYTIDEIESWDMRKTAEYCAKAEWILANLRGAEYTHDPFTGRSLEELQADREAEQKAYEEQVKNQQVETQEVNSDNNIDEDQESIERIKSGNFETIEERQKRLKLKKEKLTPEKLAELQKKYPEMTFDSSAFEDPSIDPIAGTVDTTTPALRPGW